MPPKVTQRKKEKRASSTKTEDTKRRESKPDASSSFSSKSFLPWIFAAAIISTAVLLGYQRLLPRSSQGIGVDDLYGLNFTRRWGTFRSGVYFGLKRNEPSSMVAGLMWFTNELEGEASVPLRHWCSKFEPVRYMWKRHDFDSFGVQDIQEKDYTVSQKVLIRDDGWISKIKLGSPNGTFDQYISLILYFASEAETDQLTVKTPRTDIKQGKKVDIEGVLSQSQKPFLSRIQVNDSHSVVHMQDFSLHMHPPLMFFKERVIQNLGIVRSPTGGHLFVLRDPKGEQKGPPNFVAVQIIVNKPVEVTFHLKENPDVQLFDDWKNRFDDDIEEKVFSFDQKFDEIFQLKSKNYDEAKIDFAKSVLSNMLGSIGYFHGYSFVKNGTGKPGPYGPLELTSAIPSRADFPRGFLWDEGFHQLLIAKFDPELSRKIIKNWLSLMDKNGWIPREVILGFEAMSRVPNEFMVQDVTNANPPSLYLPLEFLLESQELDMEYLKSIYPALEKWYGWFNSSQTGYKSGTYRWRGRDAKTIEKLNPLTLSSGLDDFPRATHPTEKEIHVDLRSWMALASRILYKIGAFIGDPSSVKYEQTYNYLKDNKLLDATHWSDEHQMYCDFGFHSNKVELRNISGLIQRVVLEKPTYQCVPDLGYISLFPMMLNLLDSDNPRLDAILSAIENPAYLWSPYGIRSISTKSRYYKAKNTPHDPPYWRGPIWMNMNFLILRSLKHYSQLEGPYKEHAKSIHDRLRENLVNNVFQVYQKTGFIFEHYDDTTGQGGGTHPFTGWSALILLIMSERY